MTTAHTLTRAQCIRLLDEALTFGFKPQKRQVFTFLRKYDATIEDLVTDFIPASDTELQDLVNAVGYGVTQTPGTPVPQK